MLLRQRWILAAAAFLTVLVPLVGLVFSLPNVYRSSSTVLIESQQISDQFVKSTVTGTLQIRLSSVKAQVLSRPSLGKLIRCFGLYDFKAIKSACEARLESEDLMKDVLPETAIDRMRQDVKVEGYGDPGDRPPVAINVSYRGPEPQTVAEVANALTSSYILENERMRSAQVHGTVNFLAKQLADLSAKLQQLESTAGGFKSRHIGELPEQLGANLKTLDELGSQLRTNSERMTRAVERRGSPEADLQVKELEAEAANLKRQLSLYQARVEAVPTVEQAYQALAREHETTYEGYKSLAARLQEAELAASMEDMQKGERFKVIQQAVPAEDPIEPERAWLYAWSLALALFATFLVMLVPKALNRFRGKGPTSESPPAVPRGTNEVLGLR